MLTENKENHVSFHECYEESNKSYSWDNWNILLVTKFCTFFLFIRRFSQHCFHDVECFLIDLFSFHCICVCVRVCRHTPDPTHRQPHVHAHARCEQFLLMWNYTHTHTQNLNFVLLISKSLHVCIIVWSILDVFLWLEWHDVTNSCSCEIAEFLPGLMSRWSKCFLLGLCKAMSQCIILWSILDVYLLII